MELNEEFVERFVNATHADSDAEIHADFAFFEPKLTKPKMGKAELTKPKFVIDA